MHELARDWIRSRQGCAFALLVIGCEMWRHYVFFVYHTASSPKRGLENPIIKPQCEQCKVSGGVCTVRLYKNLRKSQSTLPDSILYISSSYLIMYVHSPFLKHNSALNPLHAPRPVCIKNCRKAWLEPLCFAYPSMFCIPYCI